MRNIRDPSLLLTPHPSFQCSEEIAPRTALLEEDDEEELGRIKFACTIPLISSSESASSCSNNTHIQRNPLVEQDTPSINQNPTLSTLHFRCREESVGFLNSNENSEISTRSTSEKDDSIDGIVDPNFFDSGYTLAGRTGFQIWAGSRVMMEALLPWRGIYTTKSTIDNNQNTNELSSVTTLVQNVDACNKLKYYQHLISNGAKILELGSGVGVVGTSLAAVGGEVLLTDLPTLVDYSLWPNVIMNNKNAHKNNDIDNNDCEKLNEETKKSHSSPSWLGNHAVPIHNGWASCKTMDWSKPLTSQLSHEQIQNIELIVSCDCVWLVSMLDGLLDSVSSIFENSAARDVSFLMSFQRRDTKDGNQSSTFTTVDRVLTSVEERGWKFECLAWRRVVVSGDDDFKEEKDVFVFEIRP